MILLKVDYPFIKLPEDLALSWLSPFLLLLYFCSIGLLACFVFIMNMLFPSLEWTGL